MSPGCLDSSVVGQGTTLGRIRSPEPMTRHVRRSRLRPLARDLRRVRFPCSNAPQPHTRVLTPFRRPFLICPRAEFDSLTLLSGWSSASGLVFLSFRLGVELCTYCVTKLRNPLTCGGPLAQSMSGGSTTTPNAANRLFRTCYLIRWHQALILRGFHQAFACPWPLKVSIRASSQSRPTVITRTRADVRSTFLRPSRCSLSSWEGSAGARRSAAPRCRTGSTR